VSDSDAHVGHQVIQSHWSWGLRTFITIIILIVLEVCVRAREATSRFVCYYVNMLCNHCIEINYDEVIDIFCKAIQHLFNALIDLH
jgi:hypothetical protein